jgi:type I restriction enzyme S subunit
MSNKLETKAMKPESKRVLKPKLRFPKFRNAPLWTEKQLEEILSPVVRERKKPIEAYTGLGMRSHGKGTFLKNLENPEKNSMEYLYEVQCDDLILNITFAWEGAIAIAKPTDTGALVSHRFPTFVFNRDVAIPDFFRYIILDKQFVYSLGVISPGGAGRNRVLNKNDFLKLRVVLPEVSEQQKIAECLTSLDGLIAAHGRKLAALKAHKKGLMQRLFPCEGETQPQLRFPKFRNAPKWDEKNLEQLAKRGSGHTPSKTNPEYYNGGIKWVSLADSKRLDCGLISETEIELSEQGIENSSAVLHREGAVLVSRDAGVGKSAIMNSPMAVSQHFIVWNCDGRQLSNWFLYYLLQTMKPLFERVATGSTIKTIGLQFFIDLRVPVPLLPEQQRIASCLSALDDLIAAQTQKLEVLKAHKKGLMQQLFPSSEEES